MKKILLLIAVLVIIVGAFLYFRPAKAPEFPAGENEAASSGSFVRTGNIVKDLPGLAPGDLYLVYEEPGKPALTVLLEFGRDSTCGPAATSCMLISASNYGFALGSRVTVKGTSGENNKVQVASIVQAK